MKAKLSLWLDTPNNFMEKNFGPLIFVLHDSISLSKCKLEAKLRKRLVKYVVRPALDWPLGSLGNPGGLVAMWDV